MAVLLHKTVLSTKLWSLAVYFLTLVFYVRLTSEDCKIGKKVEKTLNFEGCVRLSIMGD